MIPIPTTFTTDLKMSVKTFAKKNKLFYITPPRTIENYYMEPKKSPRLKRKNHLPKLHFLVPLLMFQGGWCVSYICMGSLGVKRGWCNALLFECVLFGGWKSSPCADGKIIDDIDASHLSACTELKPETFVPYTARWWTMIKNIYIRWFLDFIVKRLNILATWTYNH